MVTSAKDWKKHSQIADGELTLPSGNTCLVRRLRPEAFLTSGLMPDSLSDIVHKAIKSKKGLPPDALNKMVEDPKQLTQALKMMDEVLCYVVMEPDVQMPPKCDVHMDGVPCGEYIDTKDNRHNDPEAEHYHLYMEGARDPETLYADEVDMNDKAFIFQFAVGGTADVERFRSELSTAVADVSDGKAVQGKTKRTAGSK